MSDLQKNIIESLLKERKRTKRDLAKVLNIKENSINRTLKNSNISILKLGKIADFLDVTINDLLPKQDSIQELTGEFQRFDPAETMNQLTINNLSEALNRNSKTLENLTDIISKHFPDKNLDK